MKQQFRTKYSDTCHAVPFVSDKPTKTDQSYGFDTDINNIVAGYPVRLNPVTTHYGQVDGKFMTADDYQNAMYQLAEAKSQFETLPSKIREKFHNDPKELLSFLGDSKNDSEAIKLGLKVKPVDVQPVKVEVITPTEAVTQSTPAGNSEG